MPSRILFDTRDMSIVRCQPEPYGSAGLPSFEGLCRSARIPEDEKQYYDTCIIEGEWLTYQAQRELRIIMEEQQVEEEYQVEKTDPETGETHMTTETKIVTKILPKAIYKPKVELKIDKQQVILATNPKFTINLTITDTIESDNYTSVNILLDDVPIIVNITDNHGSSIIELTEPDVYTISCNDDRFRSQPVQVEVI